jgi:hypothetical protein
MPGCDQITLGALYDCQNPLQGGAKAKLVLINLDDFGSVTVNANDIITNFTLLTNRAGYLFEGFKNSLVKSEEMVNPDSKQSVFRHKIDFTVFDISQVQKNNLQRMALGRFIAITENTQKGANTFEVYGLNSGLVMAPGVLRASNANNGAFKITLQSAEGEEEVKLPQTLFSTDYTTTLNLVTGLTFPPSITTLSVTTILVAGGTAVTVTGTNFFGGVGVNQVTSVVWVNQTTGARVNQASFTVASNTSITLTSVAVAAGPYKLEVTTTRGVALSTAIVTA